MKNRYGVIICWKNTLARLLPKIPKMSIINIVAKLVSLANLVAPGIW